MAERLPFCRLGREFPQFYSLSPFLSERFIKALPEYHVVAPVRVDASGHFLSYGLYHPVTGNSRRKRDLDGPEDRVYYRISHEEKDLFFNLSVNQEFLSKSYILERRYGNLSHVKMVASSVPPCHLRGTVLQQGTRIGTAALSACQGLVSAWVSHLPPLPQDPVLLAFTPSASGFTHTFSACRLNTCDVHGPGCQTGWGQRHKSKS